MRSHAKGACLVDNVVLGLEDVEQHVDELKGYSWYVEGASDNYADLDLEQLDHTLGQLRGGPEASAGQQLKKTDKVVRVRAKLKVDPSPGTKASKPEGGACCSIL